VVPNQNQAALTINALLDQLVQLNEGSHTSIAATSWSLCWTRHWAGHAGRAVNIDGCC
jgi:hypothetical protein